MQGFYIAILLSTTQIKTNELKKKLSCMLLCYSGGVEESEDPTPATKEREVIYE